ncbi:MAG: FkbM family methyltransferase [Rhodospirillales bacterium]|nr:FkbM family methyltransferase [Rhodospirillales bacterium]
MSKGISAAILGFSELMMAPLKARRRWLVRALAIEGFYQDIPVKTDLGTLKFHITNRQTLVIPAEFDAYEPETLEWIKGFPKGAVLWDIGANIGAFSLYAALMPETRVLAFEPAAATYAVMVKNIEINAMSERISTYPVALSDETQLGAFNMASTQAGGFMHAFEETTNVHDEVIAIRFSQATVGFTIDDFIRLFAPPKPTHIKLDVDSTEAKIIEGGKGLLSEGSVKSVYIELEGALEKGRNREIISLMNDLGYQPKERATGENRNLEFTKP